MSDVDKYVREYMERWDITEEEAIQVVMGERPIPGSFEAAQEELRLAFERLVQAVKDELARVFIR